MEDIPNKIYKYVIFLSKNNWHIFLSFSSKLISKTFYHEKHFIRDCRYTCNRMAFRFFRLQRCRIDPCFTGTCRNILIVGPDWRTKRITQSLYTIILQPAISRFFYFKKILKRLLSFKPFNETMS